MKMEHPEEEIILDDHEDKYDDVINEEEVYCVVVKISIIDSRPVERLEPQWYNDKSYLQLIN